mmetsp:Transcript_6851/g.15043  ORF Transcript_6851/g.15043 Transcript_6851/m.15043 type:complete len:145 (+) Transcript_6851:1070-1504(+)
MSSLLYLTGRKRFSAEISCSLVHVLVGGSVENLFLCSTRSRQGRENVETLHPAPEVSRKQGNWSAPGQTTSFAAPDDDEEDDDRDVWTAVPDLLLLDLIISLPFLDRLEPGNASDGVLKHVELASTLQHASLETNACRTLPDSN